MNEDQWTTLAAIPNTFNTDGTWTEMTVTNPTAFRYLRYYSTDPSHVESYCNVAEVEFYDPSSNKLSGTAFGTGPAWRRNPNDPLLDPNAPPSTNTFDKAFDGDTGTFFDYAYMHFGYTGIDLGSGTSAQVGKVRFYPRSGFAGRMQDGLFQGANTAPVTETLVGTVEIGYGSGVSEVVTRTVNYGYTTMADTLGASWLVLSSATYGDGTSAQYTYNQQWPGQRPLLLSMDDPRVAGTATKIRYEFWYSAYISGDIYAERRFSGTFDILAKFEGVGADNAGNTGRKTTYVNGITENYDLGGSHHLGSKTDVLGRKAEFGYSAGGEGFLISSTVKDSAGTVIKTTNYTRDNAGRLLSITWPDSEGHVWTHVWTRDSLGFVLTEKDENGLHHHLHPRRPAPRHGHPPPRRQHRELSLLQCFWPAAHARPAQWRQ